MVFEALGMRRPPLGAASGGREKFMQARDFAERVIALAGGVDRLRVIMDAHRREFDDAWDRDTDLIGRLLRAHLCVEHFMTVYLSSTNPRLGSLEEARLSFAQKYAQGGVSEPQRPPTVGGIDSCGLCGRATDRRQCDEPQGSS